MKVGVAMSGGVDSSTTAAILKGEGHEVYGITMKLFDHTRFTSGESNSKDNISSNIEDAGKIADKLGIPHFTLDLEDEFKREVIDYFSAEYSMGRTPNPCAICNQRMKFGTVLRFLDGKNIFHLATGHYARKIYDEEAGFIRLFRGKDKNKDQSYFLFTLNQKQLERILFPLAEFTKEIIREKASEFGLGVSEKTESNEICFIPDDDYRKFLKKINPDFETFPGEFIDTSGKKLGKHKGIHAYTIGQRKGLGISSDRPYYVRKIDSRNNTITLCRKEELISEEFLVSGLNFISGSAVSPDEGIRVQMRYRHEPINCRLQYLENGRARVKIDLVNDAPTPGQAAVFYKNDEVIGGGWIE